MDYVCNLHEIIQNLTFWGSRKQPVRVVRVRLLEFLESLEIYVRVKMLELLELP